MLQEIHNDEETLDRRSLIRHAGIAGVLAAGAAPAVHAQPAVPWRLASRRCADDRVGPPHPRGDHRTDLSRLHRFIVLQLAMLALLIARPDLVITAQAAPKVDIKTLEIAPERGGWGRPDEDPMKRFSKP